MHREEDERDEIAETIPGDFPVRLVTSGIFGGKPRSAFPADLRTIPHISHQVISSFRSPTAASRSYVVSFPCMR